MKKKRNTKYIKLLSIVLVLILGLVAIYFIDLAKFNKDHKAYDEKYMIKMMYLVADKDKTSKEDTIDTVSYSEEDKILFSMNEVIPLEKKGDYLYAYLDNFTNDKLLESTIDVVAAKNNDLGEVIDGIEYDKKTKTVKIPFSYYENIGEYDVPIEVQILSLLKVEDLMKMDVEVSTKKFITSTKKVQADNLSMETNVGLYSDNISADDLDIYINNNNVPLNKDYISYNKKTGILTFQMPAILIDKIDIKVNKPLISNIFAMAGTNVGGMNAIEVEAKPNLNSGQSRIVRARFYIQGHDNSGINAVTCHYNRDATEPNYGVYCQGGTGGASGGGMNIKSAMNPDDNPFDIQAGWTNYTMWYSYIPNNQLGPGDVMGNTDIGGAGGDTAMYKIDYSVSSTYAMKLGAFEELSFEDFNHEQTGDGGTPLVSFKGNTFKLLNLNDSGVPITSNPDGGEYTASADDMNNFWISLHCVSSTQSTDWGDVNNVFFQMSNIYEDNNSMLVKIKLVDQNGIPSYFKNGNSMQAAIGYVKFHWQNKCRVRPRKMFSTGTTIPQGAKATFALHEGYANTDPSSFGTNCPGTYLESKDVNIINENIFNGGEYYSIRDSGFDAELTIGSVYCMEETAFVDSAGNDLLAHDYKRVPGAEGYIVDDFAAVDDDGDGWCDEWPAITNKERSYCTAVQKKDSETGVALRNATFTINGGNQATTNTNGVIIWSNLPWGTYKANETTPSGTALTGTDNKTYNYFNDSPADIPLTLTEQDDNGNCPSNVATASHTDTKVYYCLKVKKVDYSTGQALTGAEFSATKGSVTIDKNSTNYATSGGITSFFLGDSTNSGNWTVTETKAPDGYEIDTTSKSLAAVALKNYGSESAARSACLNSNQAAQSSNGSTIAAVTYNSNNGNNNYVYKDKKYLINWFKTTENGSTKINGAKFKVKNSSNQYITVSAPASQTDASNVTKACYQYTGANATGTEMTVGTTAGSINMTGEVCVSGLPKGTYTVVETKAAEYHTFGASSTLSITAGTTFAAMTNSNKKLNYPTEFKFTKSVNNTDNSQEGNTKYTVTINGVTKTVSLSEMTTEELMKIGFTIYDSNGNAVPVKEVASGSYEYGANTVDQGGSGNNVTVLHLDSNRQIYVKHLPKGNYSIKEVDTSNCQLGNGSYGSIANPTSRPSTAPTCAGGGSHNGACIGYYSPDYSSNTYRFTINDCSSEVAKTNTTSCSSTDGMEVQSLTNVPTEVTLTKKDLYSYSDQADIIDKDREKNSTESEAEFENAKERSDFDRIDFKVKDSNGNYLNFIYIGNSSTTCSSDSDYSVYKYIPGLQLPSNVDPNVFNYNTATSGITVTQTLHACGGHIKLINLCRGETYTFEEIRVPDDSVYVLAGKTEACFEGPCSTNEQEQRTSKTAVINDKPTRVIFEKKDAKYNYLIPDETTTFEVYRCPKVNGNNTLCNPSDYNSISDREQAGMKLIKFEPRSEIANDEEDPGLEVYRMMSDSDAEGKSLCQNGSQSNCYVTSVHPDAGRLILRYLQSGYNYVLLETVAPVNYLLPIGRAAETPFTVVNNTVEVEEVRVPNSPTALIIRKYADKDGDNEADSSKLLGGAKFKVYKVNNYNANKKVQDQDKELIKLKTIKEGIYENRPVLDTDVVTTCTGDNCSYTPGSLGYDSSVWESIDDLIEKSGTDVTSVLKEGTALIQYLEYDTYYVIEEVEAPVGYSLPENDDNRFTLVHIGRNETKIVDTQDALINKPSSFTFYKFDEYNNPLDGAKFYLQKLDQDKKYNTLNVSMETLENGSVIYKADETSELKEITTSGGKATVYYLEPGQYRILEVEAPAGYELPKKTINVATFFVDESGLVYGNNIITNKKPSETIEYLSDSKAQLIINIQTGKVVIKYGLLITLLIGAIVGLIILLKKRK